MKLSSHFLTLIAAFAWLLQLPAITQTPDTLAYTIPAPPTGAQSGAGLGYSVAVDGDYVVAGARGDDVGEPAAGVVKVFNANTGTLLLMIPHPEPTQSANFGQSVAISGTRIVVGARMRMNSNIPDSGFAYVFDLASGTPTIPVATLSNPSAAYQDDFGHSVAISGTHVIIGAPSDDTGATDAGSAYVYDLANPTPTVPVATLNNPNPAAYELFGWSVAISGASVLVGAPGRNSGAAGSGSAYVYDLESGMPTAPVNLLNNPDPQQAERFGNTVSISGTRLAIGASGGLVGARRAGCAYVYDLATSVPTVPVVALPNPTPVDSEAFGLSVCISGTRVVVGAPYDYTQGYQTGQAYLYDLTSATPGTPVATLDKPTPANGDYFGTAVAISGARVVIGAWQDDTGAQDAGSVYLFDADSATPAAPVFTFNYPGPAPYDYFGSSVAVSGSRMVVGSYGDDSHALNAGAAHVYDLSSASPTTPMVTLNDPEPGNSADYFGQAVALSGKLVIIGAPGESPYPGRAFVYNLASTAPTVPMLTLQAPIPKGADRFGSSVAISGMRVIIGASGDNTGATNAGTAYVFDLGSASPAVPMLVLNNPAPAQDDFFGSSVAISGRYAVVGANLADAGAKDAGAAYVYDLFSKTPAAPMATLSNPDPTQLDLFGGSVSVSGTHVVVGAWRDDAGAPDAGSAYVYDLAGARVSVPMLVLHHPNPTAEAFFGEAVSISGTRIVIGASGDDAGASAAGSAYIYELSSATPEIPVATLNNPAPAELDHFGQSVAISGVTVAVGTPGDDSVAPDKGAAYVFYPAEPDSATFVPALFGPSSNSLFSGTVTAEFTLPEAAAPGTVTIVFDGAVSRTLTLAASEEYAGDHIFTFPVSEPTAIPEVALASGTIPDGIYTVTLSYRDAVGNPIATTSQINVRIDTTAPTIMPPTEGGFTPLTVYAGAALADYASQAVISDATGVAITQFPVAGTVLNLNATEHVTLTATDAAGNQASLAFSVSVRPLVPPSKVRFALGDKAPEAGTPGGPPADAALASFGVPAIDENGNLAFTAKWVSVASGKGSGLFTDLACLGVVGGDAGIAGATFKSFRDPVIYDGNVACLATITGAVEGTVVLFGPARGPLEVIAQSGTIAPDANDAKFKTFGGVAVAGGQVGFIATLAAGSGLPKTTASTDISLWLKDRAQPLRLLLREGDAFGGMPIKTIVAFKSGNGSPGAGRGWLRNTFSPLMARLTFADNTQALIEAGSSGVSTLTELPPDVAGARFASFGLPTANVNGNVAFLGHLARGTTVSKADASGIFADFGNAALETVARLGSPAGDTGASFSVLNDPVLSDDGGISFPAAIKGRAVKASQMKTVWWRPPDGVLRLLAQAGNEPPDVSGAQWRSFPSLAIATNRGPIFTATLMPGKGGVTARNASGVWACDFKGNLRLLFRTGSSDIVPGKTLANFALLSAGRGCLGVGRSCNDAQQVAWRATFVDKSQALVVTEVP